MPFTSIGATTMLAPLPVVLLSCRGTTPGFDANNLITVAWSGVVCTSPPMLSVSIRPVRHSHRQILESGAFVVNLIDRQLCRAADFCGVRSGRDIDKVAALHLHTQPLPSFPRPALQESPVVLPCTVTQRIPLGSHDLFLCRIENVYVRDSLLDEKGGVHLEKAHLVSYMHGSYHPLDPDSIGFFGYSIAGEKALKRRMKGKSS